MISTMIASVNTMSISTGFSSLLGGDTNKEWMIDLVESLVLFLHDLYVSSQTANPKMNVTAASLRFLKNRVKDRSLTTSAIEQFHKFSRKQYYGQEQSFQDSLDGFKDLLNRFAEIKDSKTINTIRNLINYAIAFSFFEKLGIEFDYDRCSWFDREMLKKKLDKTSQADFVHSILSSLHFLAEKGYQYYVTGNISAIFHSGAEYTAIINKIDEIRLRSKLLCNPEAHGFTESQYRSDLDENIEKLQSVIRFNNTLNKFEQNRFKENLNELKMLRFDLTTTKAAREHREAPFSVLLYGDSGIGKTTLKDILFYYHANLFNLPSDKTYCYTRNPFANFWDGFVTSCWCIILDDIAFKHPNLGEDESCMEFLQINNSVPFVPDQASLDKKGTTPLRAKLVIGTTNTKNLNAHFYFSCASAAQRRFPYVITPTVKEQYRDINGMLDPSLCIQQEGEYPDYWTFQVDKIISLKASPDNLGKPASFKTVGLFENINDFLSWYGNTATTFVEDQALVKSSVDRIAKISVCKICFKADSLCYCKKEQSAYAAYYAAACFRNVFNYTLYQLGTFIYINLFYYICIITCSRFESVLDYVTGLVGNEVRKQIIVRMYNRAGERMRRSLGRHEILAKLVLGITCCIATYKLSTWFLGLFSSSESSLNTSEIHLEHYEDLVSTPKKDVKKPTVLEKVKQQDQGQLSGYAPKPMAVERENVWYNEEIDISEFNVTPQITSSRALSQDQIINIIGKNCHFVEILNPTLQYRKYFKILNLGGNKFLMNNHSHGKFVQTDEIRLISGKNYGVCGNTRIHLSESSVVRNKERDLCILTIRQVNPGPNILGFFPRSETFAKQKGFYLMRDAEGILHQMEVFNSKCVLYEGSDFRTPAYELFTYTPTKKGDCGSPLVLNTPMGFMIAGIHVGGEATAVAATIVSQQLLESMMRQDEPIIQQGTPQLSAPSQSMTLGDLHQKSTLRFIEEGTAKIYGSFQGFRRRPKSTVENTPMSSILKDYGYKIKFTRPMMTSYKPARIAAVDMVDPVRDFDPDILEKCKSSFLEEILSQLPLETIKEIVHPYDIDTALNGAPGVAYVDRIKTKTSAGNPWKCKKTKFLIVKEDDPHNYILCDEMIERIERIDQIYQSKTRYHPVFCAHLKDEAVSFAKAESGKTRVFTGAPMDWSIYNRTKFLSMIRLIQNNKFIFEMGVGTVAQSMEWSKILQYLLREEDKPLREYNDHELINRFIAGDYAAFDKRMSPSFIMAGFEIMIEIAKLSGNYSEKDILAMWGIATDTAYPTVDFFGDLVEFAGSNPSGHPLTVVINGFVNSLYMRYAYYKLNPKKSVNDFQKYVRLMTYGDDNVMTSKLNWFNHTSISTELASIGVKYTMADKEAESVPFIPLSEISFLKRIWHWNYELKSYLAPLDHDSIEKMLMVWTRSKIAIENQSLAVIQSAVSEYFFYGKNVYNKKVKLLREVAEKLGLEPYFTDTTFPTWNMMKERFKNSSMRIGLMTDFDDEFIDLLDCCFDNESAE